VAPAAGATFFDALYRRFAEPDVWRVFDDVRPTLLALRQRGIKLGIISNWDERLRPLLGKLGLSEFFEAIIISHEVGHLKPAKEIFLAAVRELGFAPGAILHVGDSFAEDVQGAEAAGMKGSWLDRTKNTLADLL
jgi:putative hydrolase of the HAD superfamily